MYVTRCEKENAGAMIMFHVRSDQGERCLQGYETHIRHQYRGYVYKTRDMDDGPI